MAHRELQRDLLEEVLALRGWKQIVDAGRVPNQILYDET